VTAHAELAPKTAVAHARYTGLTSPIPERWSRTSLAAFRFTFLYFGAYVLTTQMWNDFLAIPSFGVPELSKLAPMRNLVMWVGHTVFHVKPILAPRER
jgi:hypothetical protein